MGDIFLKHCLRNNVFFRLAEEELASSNQQHLNSNFALEKVALKRCAFKDRVSEIDSLL